MRTKLTELNARYNEIVEEINTTKAAGDLSKLCNLRSEFDETFDTFFDRKELRLKYNGWDLEEDVADFNAESNTSLEEKLDDEDLKDLITFYENYIGRLEDELSELRA